MQCILADQIPPSPWRNGGGQTRELQAWPPGVDWQRRISLADIDRDGPFSPFAGVQRHFAVLEGAGVRLGLNGQTIELGPHSEPLAFDGAAAPDCHLINGPTRDLNLMLRGLKGTLERVRGGTAWDEPWRWRAVFSTGAAHFEGPDGQTRSLAPRTLLLDLPAGPCRLWTLDEAPAFWLGSD